MKDHKKPQTWIDSLEKRPQQKNMDMRYGTWNVIMLEACTGQVHTAFIVNVESILQF
jgi:hypothetical protein